MDSHRPSSGNALDILSFITGNRVDEVDISSKPASDNATQSESSTSLSKLKNIIEQLEINKYPTSLYSCNYHQIEYDDVPTKIMTVQYNPKVALSSEHLHVMKRNSVYLRKLNLLAGTLYMLDKSGSYLVKDSDKRNKIREILDKFIEQAKRDYEASGNNKKNAIDPQDEVGEFIDKLIDQIAVEIIVDKDTVLRQVRNAEQYFIAENNNNRILVVETSVGSLGELSFHQVDIPLGNHLTTEQKQEYIKIHNESKPLWFDRMDNWEKDWLLAFIPPEMGGDWFRFENLFQTSAMQHLPGIKNARSHYLLRQDEHRNLAVISSTTKVATLVPYEMPESLQLDQAYQNVQQLVPMLGKQAHSNFHKIWKNIFDDKGIKPLVLIQSLLSDSIVAAADTELTEKQKNAIEQFTKNRGKDAGLTIISANDPVNILRAATVQNDDRWKDVDLALTYADTLLKNLSGNLTSEIKLRKILIDKAYKELKKMKDRKALNRAAAQLTGKNFEAFKTAYLSVLVEALGGVVSTNCKSGKDRTGLHELYHDAMMVFFERNQKLPSYNSTEDRRKFKLIFKSLFNSMKAHEAAAANTPGSFGLKDSAKMLCKDIADELGDSYSESNKRADMNKPASFIKDEAKQHKAVMSSENEGIDRQLAHEFESLLVNVYRNLESMVDSQHALTNNEDKALFEMWEQIQLLLLDIEKIAISLIRHGDVDNSEVKKLMRIIYPLTEATCITDISAIIEELGKHLNDDKINQMLFEVLDEKTSKSPLGKAKSIFNLKSKASNLMKNETSNFIRDLNKIIHNLSSKSTVTSGVKPTDTNYASHLTVGLLSDANRRTHSNIAVTTNKPVILAATANNSNENQEYSEISKSNKPGLSSDMNESKEIIDVMKDIHSTLQEIQKTLNEMLRLLTVLKNIDNSDKEHVAFKHQGLFRSDI